MLGTSSLAPHVPGTLRLVSSQNPLALANKVPVSQVEERLQLLRWRIRYAVAVEKLVATPAARNEVRHVLKQFLNVKGD